jgi:uncharacterized membrane protein YccC
VLAELFALPQGYWAIFSTIIIVQASVGGSIKATTDRLIGTVGGAVAGGAVAYLFPHTSVLSLGVALVQRQSDRSDKRCCSAEDCAARGRA